MSRFMVRSAMLCLTLVGIVGLLSAIVRAMGNDLTTAMESQPKLEIAFAIMLIFPAFWAISKFKASMWRIIGMAVVVAFALVLIKFVAPDDFVDPDRDETGMLAKVIPLAVLIAATLVINLYEKKRNKTIAKGYVMRFGLAFKKCCDGYDVVSEDGCAMRNTPYGIEFYDAEGNPTAFKATDISSKWKIDKGESE